MLILRATDDPFAAPHAAELRRALPQARVVDIAGGMVPLPDQLPEAFAAAVLDVPRRRSREGRRAWRAASVRRRC